MQLLLKDDFNQEIEDFKVFVYTNEDVNFLRLINLTLIVPLLAHGTIHNISELQGFALAKRHQQPGVVRP